MPKAKETKERPLQQSEFSVFRWQVTFSQQRDLLDTTNGETSQSRRQLVEIALADRPTLAAPNGRQWHIGNVVPLGSDGAAFAIGRSSKRATPILDPLSRNFLDSAVDEAPYTFAVIDLRLQLVAFMKRPQLSASERSTARKFRQLMESNVRMAAPSSSFLVDSVFDPTDLVAEVQSAHSVPRFRVAFGHPNVFDAEKDFQQPLQKLVSLADATKAETLLRGNDLDRDFLEKTIRAAAAVGSNPAAWVVREHGERAIRRDAGANHLRVVGETIEPSQEVRQGTKILSQIRDAYERIRNRAK